MTFDSFKSGKPPCLPRPPVHSHRPPVPQISRPLVRPLEKVGVFEVTRAPDADLVADPQLDLVPGSSLLVCGSVVVDGLAVDHGVVVEDRVEVVVVQRADVQCGVH